MNTNDNYPGQKESDAPQYRGSRYYVPESHRMKAKSRKPNMDAMVAVIILGVMAFILLLLLGIYLLSRTDVSQKPDNDVTVPTVAVTGEYLVRKSAYDDQSQVGAYDSYADACDKARENKYNDYEVYDNYGNMLYTPEDAILNPDSSQVKYRVRLGSYDSKTQIGAFANYTKALECVKQRSNEGYKIFDMNGNVLYDPYTAIK